MKFHLDHPPFPVRIGKAPPPPPLRPPLVPGFDVDVLPPVCPTTTSSPSFKPESTSVNRPLLRPVVTTTGASFPLRNSSTRPRLPCVVLVPPPEKTDLNALRSSSPDCMAMLGKLSAAAGTSNTPIR